MAIFNMCYSNIKQMIHNNEHIVNNKKRCLFIGLNSHIPPKSSLKYSFDFVNNIYPD